MPKVSNSEKRQILNYIRDSKGVSLQMAKELYAQMAQKERRTIANKLTGK